FESCRPDFALGKIGESREEKVESRKNWEFTPHVNDQRLLSLLYSVYFLLSTFLVDAQMAFSFENLNVYQRAVDFADQIFSMTDGFKRGYGFLSDQLNRAALSISANIAEGNGRFTKADRKNFFGIARGSLQECVPLLELAHRRQLLSDGQHSQLKSELEEISQMLSGLIKGLEHRQV
ncbi:MAG: four helix bundle protein, partial [Planctomycetota bacterium]|nr:four helix bundle protein [Planctomycetota bacterium]